MSRISNIKLIKTSNWNESNAWSLSKSGTNVSFTIPTNNDLGNYMIQIVYNNGAKIISPLVSIYDSSFDIKNYNPEIRITNFNIQDYYIKFKGKYNENQIKKAYMVYDQYESNEQTVEVDFEYDKKNNGVKIKENLTIIDKEQLHFEFVEILQHRVFISTFYQITFIYIIHNHIYF